jgi:hypothetical protein
MGEAPPQKLTVGARRDPNSMIVHAVSQQALGRLRRGNFIILPLEFSFIWRIPIGTTNESDE